MPKKSTFTGITSVPSTYFFDVFGQGFNYRISKSNLFQQIESEIGTPGVQSLNDLSGALQLIAGTNMSIAINEAEGTFTFNGSLAPTSIQSIAFDTSAEVVVSEGEIAWNAEDGTVDIGVPGGSVIQTGQEVTTRVRNSTGSTLVDGEAVFITGSTGNNTVVARAQANAPTADLTIGIVTQTIPNGQTGLVTLIGKVRDFDTSAWSEGDELFLSASVAGEITNVQPAAPNHSVHIGYVVRSSATVGIIYVRVHSVESVSELHDVVLTSTQDRNLLILDAASQTWENGYLDYGDFAGAEDIVLQNNVALRGDDSGGDAKLLVRLSTDDIARVGSPDNVLRFTSSVVPQALYGGNTWDVITTEGGQEIDGDLTADEFKAVDATQPALDVENTDTSSAFVRLRNSAGGVRPIVGASGAVSIQQTTSAGAFEQDWMRFNRNGGVDLFDSDVVRFSTTTTGVSVEGTTLEVNTVVYTWPASDAAGVLSSDGAGNLTWGGVSGQVFAVNAGAGSTPENGDRLSFGQGTDHDNGAIVIPRDARLILATGRFTNATDTITIRLIVNGAAQAATYDLSVTGTAGSNEDVTVDVEGTPLSLSAGDSLNYEFITGAPTNSMDSASVGIWFIFD